MDEKTILAELVAIEDEFGAGSVARLLLHMARQLNLGSVSPATDEQYKRAFPIAEFPRLYDRDGAIVREAATTAAA
jgi:hypothetical protein